MFCTSIQINQFQNGYLCHHLKGIDLQYIEKLFLNAACEGKKGHNLKSTYQMPLNYTARILGRGRESVRLAQERLHARGIITVDGKDWNAYRHQNGKRIATGYPQVIGFSTLFLRTMGQFLKRQAAKWIFDFTDGFKTKARRLKEKAVAARERYLKNSPINREEVKGQVKQILNSILSETRTLVRRPVPYRRKESPAKDTGDIPLEAFFPKERSLKDSEIKLQ